MVKAWADSKAGVVASEQSLASFAGAQALARGGNAVDATVATGLALSVLIPHLGGVGGDFFMLYRDPDGRVFFVNGSGTAPESLTLDELRARGLDSIPERGPLTPVVPGFIAGLYESWRRFGRLEWGELVKPALKIASQGFPLPPSTGKALSRLKPCLEQDPGSRQAVVKALPPEPGAPARMPGLAALLRGTMEDPLYLYRGEPAEALEEYLISVGGVMTSEDLARYRPLEDRAIRIEYRGWTVYEMPPNTQGVTALHILKGLEKSGLPENPFSRERVEVLERLARKAYKVRDENVGDPRFMSLSPEEILEIDLLQGGGEPLRGNASLKGGGDTTFFAVADVEGGVVAGIQSLFYPFGSCVTEPRFQITLNNRALGFTLQEGLPRTLRPGARPLHTLSAIVMERGGRVVALGASGGLLRPQQHALFVTNIVDYGMPVLEAINAPRALWDPGRDAIICEEGFECPESGSRVERIGVASAVEVIMGRKAGYTDLRGDGIPTPAIA